MPALVEVALEQPKPTAPAAPIPATSQELQIAEPQFDVASAQEFTRDGSMAIGRLNGATVLGWAITAQDPIRVKKRGLRAPAYGQNALRIAPTRASQRSLETNNETLVWTTLQKKSLRLASLN